MKRILTLVSMAMIAASSPQNGFTMGKKSSTAQASSTCSAPSASIATPIRNVVVAPVKSQRFPLPNGTMADLTPSLGDIMIAAVNGTGAFHPILDPQAAPDACNSYLRVSSYVTAIEMDLYDFKLSVGYSPDGVFGLTPNQIQGEANVRIGRLDMVFAVEKCQAGLCSTILTSKVGKNSIDSDYHLRANFNTITGGADLVQHPSFNKILTQIMDAGMKLIAQSPDLNKLPWTAIVRESNSASGTLIFDAGHGSGIANNQAFVIYAAEQATGNCNLYKAVAYVHTTRVDPISSVAIVDQSLDQRGIKDGDVVMVKSR